MSPMDLCGEAARSLALNKKRAALASLGVTIGIAAIVAMTAAVGGVQSALFDNMGLNAARTVYVMPATKGTLTSDIMNSLSDVSASIEAVGVQRASAKPISTPHKTSTGVVYGVGENHFTYQSIDLRFGRFFSNYDNEEVRTLALVGPGIVEEFLTEAGEEAIGEEVDIDGVAFTVIGVIDSENALDQDYSAIYVPEKTAELRLGMGDIQYGYIYVSQEKETEAVVDRTFDYLERELKLSDARDAFSIVSSETIRSMLGIFSAGFSGLMVIIASISLLVGGIGIMNMMLANVASRTREIGIRRALGATKTDILVQFLLESIFVCLLGGVAGVFLGGLLSLGISAILGTLIGAPLHVSISFEIASCAFFVCVGVGVIFGCYPARKATFLSPAVAFRV